MNMCELVKVLRNDMLTRDCGWKHHACAQM